MLQDFEKLASSQSSGGFFSDYWHLLRQNRKWWMIPLFVVLFLFATLMILGGTGAAPFIYTLF